MAPTARSIIRTYLVITGLFNAAMALIWGVNTLFLMRAGLDIFQVMLVNGAFSLGQFVFEVPTGVVADTVGRRTSLLFCFATVFVATIAYVAIPRLHLGVWSFVGVSVLLGLGFTFYTGALDAWLVDALKHVGYTEALDGVFSRMQSVFGAAMLLGTIGGGFLAQVNFELPYYLRAALVVPSFVVAWTGMKEIGFQTRKFTLSELPAETKRVFQEGMRYGLGHAVVRPLMLVSFVTFVFSFFGFYSWQRYFLDLLGRDLAWVTGLIAALVAFSSIVGNALVRPMTKVFKTRTGLIAATAAVQGVTIVLCGVLHGFYSVVALYLVSSITWGASAPVKQTLLNANIPSAQRATIISFDSLFGDVGAGAGQLGLGYLAKVRSIAAAWVVAGVILFLRIPILRQAQRHGCASDLFVEPPPKDGAVAPETASPCEQRAVAK